MALYNDVMISRGQLWLALPSFLLGWAIYKLFIYPRFLSIYKDMPGPPHTFSLRGDLPAIFKAGPGEIHQEFLEQYGPVVRYQGFLGVCYIDRQHYSTLKRQADRMMFTDPKALTHVFLTNTYVHPKMTRIQLERILGKVSFSEKWAFRLTGQGLLFAAGDDHKRQRKIMTPSFSQAHVNALVPVFQEKARTLREQWLSTIEAEATDEKGSKTAVVDVSRWFSRATLDIIGSAGFNYEFGSLTGETSGLAKAFESFLAQPFSAGLMQQILFMIIVSFPSLTAAFPTSRSRKIKANKLAMQQESKKILDEARRRLKDESASNNKDLITLLLRANMDSENEKSRMSDEEVMGQMTTFLLAGHETTASALNWTIQELSLHPEIQQKLRDEAAQAIQQAQSEGRQDLTPSELDNLPYLDAVTRESLRLHAPVASTIRHADEDDMIPLSQSLTLKNGQVVDHIQIKKGTDLFMPLLPFNTSKEIWGEDSYSYRPERWIGGLTDKTTEKTKGGFTAYSHLLTFGGGVRGCIGYRFSVLELKAILFDIAGHFSFAPRDDKIQIIGRSGITTRPFIKGQEKDGSQLPIRITAV